MTRLRSDSSTTDEDEPLTSRNIRPNTPIRSSEVNRPDGPHTIHHHLNADASEDSENNRDSLNYIPLHRVQRLTGAGDELEGRGPGPNYSQELDETDASGRENNDEDEHEDDNLDGGHLSCHDDQGSPVLLEEAVYEFALSSARRFTLNHEESYDLRPNFAILKHKTEQTENICNRGENHPLQRQGPLTSRSQLDSSRTYPKTPDWFFNIPDVRSPFPNFESKLSEDIDQ